MTHDETVMYLASKKYMDYVRGLKLRMETLRNEIDALNDGLKAVDYSGDKVSTSCVPDGVERNAIKAIEMIAAYTAESAEYAEVSWQAHIMLKKLQAEQCACLTKHYILGSTWEQTCVDMEYTWGGMMKLRKRALIALYEFLPEEAKRNFPNAEVI